MKTEIMATALLIVCGIFGCSKAPEQNHPVQPSLEAEVDYAALTEEKAIAAAKAAARKEGYDLSEYQSPTVRIDRSKGEWWISFEMLPPTPPGGHFSVLIEAEKKSIRVFAGE